MYCSNCGKDVGNSKFCTNCGMPVSMDSVEKETKDNVAVAKVRDGQFKKHIAIVAAVVLLLVVGVVLLLKVGQGSEAKNRFANANVGDSIFFGSYEQDNNLSNGRETIAWRVLAKEGNKILVISQHALDSRPYNNGATTWENSELRTWLNGLFFDTAFTSEEQSMIIKGNVSADWPPSSLGSYAGTGNDTKDCVFLLSVPEANKYFMSDIVDEEDEANADEIDGIKYNFENENRDRVCTPTPYAEEQGVYTRGSDGGCYWWLRSPGADSAMAANITYYGGIHPYGSDVDDSDLGVRPAMWIKV